MLPAPGLFHSRIHTGLSLGLHKIPVNYNCRQPMARTLTILNCRKGTQGICGAFGVYFWPPSQDLHVCRCRYWPARMGISREYDPSVLEPVCHPSMINVARICVSNKNARFHIIRTQNSTSSYGHMSHSSLGYTFMVCLPLLHTDFVKILETS